ncbi:hypothetical protein P152DRAFT_264159 [Eremomyces bilateralis CBS 781.70]|uniref:Ubiquitin-like domain-containing protein n=1 Tax=Eremomyces bilateralis CBS 781.70 TaxID=1392243 RepID=A0A6G1G7Y5_9PEZI|nr:uncharacterized protein P152DRAFT_264159 [Eremomyces bilateralis CBS 781.70]KAF1814215.1 hypothetical protein P152DRAFT_264159 [Eremomyces bilateralis CBS 781.70]
MASSAPSTNAAIPPAPSEEVALVSEQPKTSHAPQTASDAPSAVEMNDLPSTPAVAPEQPESTAPAPPPTQLPSAATDAASAPVTSADKPDEKPIPPTDASTPLPTDAPAPETPSPVSPLPKTPVLITLLLTSGARHAMRIDEKYLGKRSMKAEDGDPFNISVYNLKELVWNEWKEEWEERPVAPSSIRLIHFGRMLEDNTALRDCRFNADNPNVVHMTVRPQELVEEEDTKATKAAARDRDAEGRESTRCCVIL